MKEAMEALRRAMEEKQVMAVYRDGTGDSWSGIPVMVDRGIAVLAQERDFVLDGYIAIGEGQITGVERYDDSDFVRRAMAGEGVYRGCQKPGLPGCGDWKELLEGVAQSFGGWCIAECTDDEGELCFYVGKTASLGRDGLELRPVGADGCWLQDTVSIPYEDLCTVSFGGNYLRVYRKYMKNG